MHPYEIRQLRDGSVDYNNYYARPVSCLPALVCGLRHSATGARKLMSLTAALAVYAASGLLNG